MFVHCLENNNSETKYQMQFQHLWFLFYFSMWNNVSKFSSLVIDIPFCFFLINFHYTVLKDTLHQKIPNFVPNPKVHTLENIAPDKRNPLIPETAFRTRAPLTNTIKIAPSWTEKRGKTREGSFPRYDSTINSAWGWKRVFDMLLAGYDRRLPLFVLSNSRMACKGEFHPSRSRSLEWRLAPSRFVEPVLSDMVYWFLRCVNTHATPWSLLTTPRRASRRVTRAVCRRAAKSDELSRPDTVATMPGGF